MRDDLEHGLLPVIERRPGRRLRRRVLERVLWLEQPVLEMRRQLRSLLHPAKLLAMFGWLLFVPVAMREKLPSFVVHRCALVILHAVLQFVWRMPHWRAKQMHHLQRQPQPSNLERDRGVRDLRRGLPNRLLQLEPDLPLVSDLVLGLPVFINLQRLPNRIFLLKLLVRLEVQNRDLRIYGEQHLRCLRRVLRR